MITFDDVRRTTETTFFFFPDGLHEELRHFLGLAGFTEGQDFLILNYTETQRRYPAMDIPMVPDHPDLKDIPNAYDKPLTMISHMNIEDLERKLWEIDDSDETNQWRQQQMDELDAAIQAENEALRGWLPGLERESEDVE